MKTLKNSYDNKKLLLYHWIRVIQELYPKCSSQNPFQQEFEAIAQHLTLDERLLFHDVLHSITLINNHSNEDHQLVSTHSDFMNTLRLVMPKELILNLKAIETHERLVNLFRDTAFTYLEACIKLKLSKSTFKRQLKPLMFQGLIVKLAETREKKALFQVAPIKPNHQETIQDIFETMQGDWKDFVGFVEF